jgi:hypothetical protein
VVSAALQQFSDSSGIHGQKGGAHGRRAPRHENSRTRAGSLFGTENKRARLRLVP